MVEALTKAARSELIALVFRAVMTLGLGVGSFIGSRVMSQQDTLQATVAEQSVTLKLLSSQVKDKLELSFEKLSDHETRLRVIERRATN